MCVYGGRGLMELAAQNLAKAEYAKSEFRKQAKVLFGGSPTFNEFVVQGSEDAKLVNDRLLKRRIIGGFPLKKFYPELGNAAVWCCTELTTKEQIDIAVKAVK
jgi:glycine dehydrogenase subunit 1